MGHLVSNRIWILEMYWVKTAAAPLEKELQEEQKSHKKKNALMEFIMKYFTNLFKNRIFKVASLS